LKAGWHRLKAHRLAVGRPLVTLSFAQSLDGSLAALRGQPTQISGLASQRMTHRLRAMHSCILVGIGTVLVDDPLLTVAWRLVIIHSLWCWTVICVLLQERG